MGTTVPNLGSGGSAYDGVISGEPETVEGVKGSALAFSAETQGVATANAVPLDTFTVAAWVKASGGSTASQRIIVGYQDTSNANTKFFEFLGTNGNRFWAFIQNTSAPGATEIPSDDTANWHHVAMTYDGRIMTFYYDGEAILTQEYAYARQFRTSKLGFGNNVILNGEFWNGAMDEALVFDRAISAEEVGMVMNDTWKRMDVLNPDSDLIIAAGATVDLGGTDQTVATLTLGDHLYKLGETTWGPIDSGAEYETDQLTGTGILRVKGPLDGGTIIFVR